MVDTGILIHWDVGIPLRDGLHLSATLYRSRHQLAPAPCVVTLGPYISDSNHTHGVYFAEKGLTFVVVDSRGRGNSEGTFRPFIQEAQDAYDVIEWLARQPYCNGKVGMWGHSYLGYTQWAAVKEFPPHLATIVPAAAVNPGLDFPMRNNIFSPYAVQWLILTGGRASQKMAFSDNAFWSMAFRRWHESGRPFRELDDFIGNPLTTFQEWLEHPTPDAYWDACSPVASQYAEIAIPILTITGSYDDDQPGALEYYKQHMLNASADARARHYLVIGPWDHPATRTPTSAFGGLEFGAASVVDMSKLQLDWYAWIMQGDAKPDLLKGLVTYYVMGADEWRYANSLDEVTAGYKTCLLDSKQNANDIFSAGTLGDELGAGLPDTYTYHPGESYGPEVEAEACADGESLVDQTLIFALRGRQLVYHSAPFERDTEVSGFFSLTAWIAIDCPDTDLYVSVHEIGLDGTSIRLSTDAIRARYRQGLRSPNSVQTGVPLHYDFNHFTFVSRRIGRGHRLRLVIAPMGRLMGSTFAEKNYNIGGCVAQESADVARPVTVSLFHDDRYPSALYVPLGQI